jgi:hypothetical protein
MHQNKGKKPDVRKGPRRRVLSNGVIEEWSAAMGRSLIIPADPHPRKIDVSADAPGWERLRTFRLGG